MFQVNGSEFFFFFSFLSKLNERLEEYWQQESKTLSVLLMGRMNQSVSVNRN